MSKEKFVPLSQTQLGIYLDCVRRGSRYILGNSVRKINLKNSPGISETAINP